jgi:bifunctional non-homologous end joining protein LigD
MLAMSGALPRDDEGWAYEFKWDGVRAMVYVEGGRVRALSRNDKELADSFPELRQVGDHLGGRRAILDGELVAFDDRGRPSFGRLQQRLHLGSDGAVRRRMEEFPASFLAFDLLYLSGRLLVDLPYDDRRDMLEDLQLGGESIATPRSFRDRHGADVLDAARRNGLEGVVAKRRRSAYLPGLRRSVWLKIKNFLTQEVVIGGWTEGNGERRASLGALLLGLPGPGGLQYVGKVGTGFDEATRKALLVEMEPLSRQSSPFATPLSRAENALAHYVEPVLVSEVRYGEWTKDGLLRHPVWRGMRRDKKAGEVRREL